MKKLPWLFSGSNMLTKSLHWVKLKNIREQYLQLPNTTRFMDVHKFRLRQLHFKKEQKSKVSSHNLFDCWRTVHMYTVHTVQGSFPTLKLIWVVCPSEDLAEFLIVYRESNTRFLDPANCSSNNSIWSQEEAEMVWNFVDCWWIY